MEEKITPFVEKDEKLIACGSFQTRISVIDRAETADFSDLANRSQMIGVTDKRLIVVPLDRKTSEPEKEEVISVSFSDVKIDNDGLLISHKSFGKPIKYLYVFGYKVSKDQFSMFFPGFLEAIENSKKAS